MPLDENFPILEFDSTPEAMIEPSKVIKKHDEMPERCVLCFFAEVITKVCQGAQVVFQTGSEIGSNPVYRLETEDGPVAVMHPGVGASLSAAFLEEAIALGATKFIACGGAGVLKSDIVLGHAVVAEAAVRDEGTSYHYLPPSREVEPSPSAVRALVATLEAHEVPYIMGKTWTTDAVYRETPAKIARRRAEGCVTVEMEAAAFFAVAQFRGVTFGQLLYGGDDLGGDIWDSRSWNHDASTREKLFWLAVEAVQRL